MIDKSNPAGRLHSLMLSAKKCADNSKVLEVWATVLDMEPNEAEVIHAILEVYNLAQEVKKLVELRAGDAAERYLSNFNAIESALIPLNVNATWNNFKPKLSDGCLTRLEFCAHFLEEYYQEESLSEEDLEDIKSKLDELLELVQRSSLPEELRIILLDEAWRIRRSIGYYKISGARGVKESLQAMVGAIYANQDVLKDNSLKEPDVIRRLGELLDKLDSFTSRALKLHKILKQPVSSLLKAVSDSEDGATDDL